MQLGSVLFVLAGRALCQGTHIDGVCHLGVLVLLAQEVEALGLKIQRMRDLLFDLLFLEVAGKLV